MPTGKVRFFDAEKGFGFITKDGGGDVYVRSTALADGVAALHAGQRVDFGVVAGRRGEQALNVRVLEQPPSLSKASRKKPAELAIIIEDLIQLLDGVGNGYRANRHPDPKMAAKAAQVLRYVADELEK
ncbi:cold-shock protein [Tessaracoccus sp. OH4464_COT-324]|uniref:cold-shock protein n=1 Tax=Tessaracoccus sp. OH4464_COT-324 TaxID=2491059 RepID=UPI000F6417B2|nr:cold-shock protein [Tessaracoccus sp. OH4464_COT-324]RRD46719.1 cold-shock protein [Tessaracoccus sp. OH4464_COT-324]